MRHIHLLILSLLLLPACTPSRRLSTSVVSVYDTTHVIVNDTVRITQVHDSIVFHASERTHEQETITYDPVSGNPTQRQFTRDTERDIDALVRHLADSLFAALSCAAESAHTDDTTTQLDEQRGDSSLSVWTLMARKVSTLLCILVVIVFIVFAVRLYLRRTDSGC